LASDDGGGVIDADINGDEFEFEFTPPPWELLPVELVAAEPVLLPEFCNTKYKKLRIFILIIKPLLQKD
jgi:hypothetical protein